MDGDGNDDRPGSGGDPRGMMREEPYRKSVTTAYVLCLFLGALGLHRIYLRRNTSALVLFGLTVLSVLLSFAAVGPVVFFVVAVWLVVDLFLIPGMARDCNDELLKELK